MCHSKAAWFCDAWWCVCQSVCVCVCVCQSVCVCVCLWLSVWLSVYVYFCVSLCVCMSVYVCVCACVCVCVCVCIRCQMIRYSQSVLTAEQDNSYLTLFTFHQHSGVDGILDVFTPTFSYSSCFSYSPSLANKCWFKYEDQELFQTERDQNNVILLGGILEPSLLILCYSYRTELKY